MQFGPTSREPPARAAATMWSSSSLPATVSPKPLDDTWANRTLPPALERRPGIDGAATETYA